MFIPIKAESTTLSAEHARLLDDEFFLSDPLAHFSSRISMLLEANRSTETLSLTNEPEFLRALGLDGGETALSFTAAQRRIRVASDALQLRHHAAEGLLRFLYAVSASTPRAGDSPSTWLAVADSPASMKDVIDATKASLDDDPRLFLNLLFLPGTVVEGDFKLAADTALAWVQHSVRLLTDPELSVNAANNKVKHGLAVSVRGDVRIEFTTQSPNADGTIPLSAFGPGKSVPLFDRPMLTYLSRPQGVTPKHGVELVSLRVDPPVALAETWMIATVYSALMHVAAHKHFGGELPAGAAPYPRLVAGRLPEHVVGGAPLGYRSAVTFPPDGSTSPRPSGVFFHKTFWPMEPDFASKTSAVVVDD